MDITLYYDKYTNKYYIQIIRQNNMGKTERNRYDKIIHAGGFNTEIQAMSYLIDYCETIHTCLIRA